MTPSVPARAISRDDDSRQQPSAALMAQDEEPEPADEPEPELEPEPEPEPDDDEPDPPDDDPEPEELESAAGLDSRFSDCLASCLSAPEAAERSISRLRLAVP